MLPTKEDLFNKYHSGNLWSNTCCSHPVISDLNEVKAQAVQRLEEEIGLISDIDFLFEFEYQEVCGELMEHEQDFVFAGLSSETPLAFDKSEVSECRWMKLEDVRQDVTAQPDKYTKWLAILVTKYYDQFIKYLDQH
jgi:isopentenyl-diphosphate delta-isomerase